MNKDERERAASRRSAAFALSFVLIALCTLAAVAAARAGRQKEAHSLMAFPGAVLEDYERAYEESGSTEDLILLLRVLCYQAETEKKEGLADRIREHGTELLRRAKEGEADLKALDDREESLLELLRVIRSYGAS